MNLIQRAMQKVFGEGQSESASRRREWRERWFPIGTRNQNAGVSRQATRAALRDKAYAEASLNGDWTRKERRSYARAVAAKVWRGTGESR